ncbi:TPA: hypothetical protein ACFN66_000538 [Neisseria meningitidis]
MTDIFTTSKRSFVMSKIHSKETKPEVLVRKFLFFQGFRYRKNDKRYVGKPDGFKVIVVWECELKNKAIGRERLNRLVREIKDAV